MNKQAIHPYHYETTVLNHMNMPFTVQFVVKAAMDPGMQRIFDDALHKIDQELALIDQRFSPFKADSWVSLYPKFDGQVPDFFFHPDYVEVLTLTMWAKKVTKGVFDAFKTGVYNPTGLVKGWAIERVFTRYLKPLVDDHLVVAVALNGGGDMMVASQATDDFIWHVGIENPDNLQEIIAVHDLKNGAIATSGRSKRGDHIWLDGAGQHRYQQVTVYGDSLVEADMWATTGIAADVTAWDDFVAAHHLSGLVIAEEGQIDIMQAGAWEV
ncbi:FAD:protein FMN transferase [Aerococcus agrisoli]|uniref:FAD:protein FMN transferase n=1 Tax=Aerococcus agrisoli TaxID=2487350 RepID=A0A3N4FZ08_9LACT|nr:FAD:protein FMN transferase [Aerococcus agrisoli]RPA55919.1 FAD:protein FMN transferase [Aerococcus agrisoli]